VGQNSLVVGNVLLACVGNKKTGALMEKWHLDLCDNEATALQYEILAKQLPSMNQRIVDAYKKYT
jgi:hypothetical protein